MERPRCEDRGCQEEFAEQCGGPDEADPDCGRGDVRECRERCVAGRARCEGGRWGACEGEVACRERECAADYPDQCEAPPEPECGPREARPGR